jgi:hypothetical protein
MVVTKRLSGQPNRDVAIYRGIVYFGVPMEVRMKCDTALLSEQELAEMVYNGELDGEKGNPATR